MYICKFITIKVNFAFYKQCRQAETRLISKRTIFPQNASIVVALISLFRLKKILWNNYLRFWKQDSKRPPQSAPNSFSKKSDLKFCIQQDFIRQHPVFTKIRLACSRALLLIISSSNIAKHSDVFIKRDNVLLQIFKMFSWN